MALGSTRPGPLDITESEQQGTIRQGMRTQVSGCSMLAQKRAATPNLKPNL